MKPKTTLPETAADYAGVYTAIYENNNGNKRVWLTKNDSMNIMAQSHTFKGTTAETPPIFSELKILFKSEKQIEWRETARWIKFEETVEDGGNRWSKPYVGTLLLQSLTHLKQLLFNANLMLDIEVDNMDVLVKIIIENLLNAGVLPQEERNELKTVLLKPQRHQYEINKNTKNESKPEKKNATETIKKHKNKHFLRKVPSTAEACNILVGEVEFLKKNLVIFVRLKNATVINKLTEAPVPTRFVFIILGPTFSNFREIGRAMATLMCDKDFRTYAYHATEAKELIEGINVYLESVLLIPTTQWNPTIRIEPPVNLTTAAQKEKPPGDSDTEDNEHDSFAKKGLIRTGRLFGGLINDVKRKAPWYWSDFTDALNMQCVATWLFLYFACLSPIITFGGLLSEATGKNIATMESLVSGLICGLGYGFFSGQPLTILSSTGPVLVFESIVYEYCQNQGLDFLTFRFWVGTWIAVILMVLTAFDASAAVGYITRFTEENFATLIAFIFICKSFENVLSISHKYPIQSLENDCGCMAPLVDNDTLADNETRADYANYDRGLCLLYNGSWVGADCDKSPVMQNVFLMSVLLFLCTYLISVSLKNFKSAYFFSTFVRQFISDFAVIIAILTMSSLDYYMAIATPKLEVPTDIRPTLPTRGWLIPAFHEKNPTWTTFAAIIPALLGTILIFMDQQITAVIVNRKENKLLKGCGFHLDLFILSILIQICTVMGLPWFVGATVLSLNHVNSLKKDTECSAPGEKPQYLGIYEQRATQIMIFVTIGLSVFLTPLLRHIPMPVLYGVFFYMGVATLKGLQFYERILIMFMPAKYQPDYAYIRKVPIKRVHLFTMIQLACLAALWIIKSFSQTSILFPLMLVVMIGIRKILDYVFTQRELKILDDLMPGMSKPSTTTTTTKKEKQGNINKGYENTV